VSVTTSTYLPSLGMQGLGAYFGTDFISATRCWPPSLPMWYQPKKTTTRGRNLLLNLHEGRADMSIMEEVERAIGWPLLWDLALDNCAKHIEGLNILV